MTEHIASLASQPAPFSPLPLETAGLYTKSPLDQSADHYLMTSSIDKEQNPYSHPPSASLLPWHREALPFYGLLCALFMQGALLSVAAWLTHSPVFLPTGMFLFGLIGLKSFNVTITVLGAICGGLAAFGIGIGARAYLSRKLLTGGLSLSSYKCLYAIGSGSVIHRFSRDAFASLALLILAGLASSAVVGVFSASIDFQTLNLALRYPTVDRNPLFYGNASRVEAAVLQSAEDFDAFTNIAARYLLGGLHVNQTVSYVENVAMTPGDGIVPSILPVVTFTSGINSSYLPLTRFQKLIVSNSSSNTYRFAAPVAVSNSSCVADAGLNLTSTLAGQHLLVTVSDPVCGTSELAFRQANRTVAAALSCLYPYTGQSVNDLAARLVFFTINPVTREFLPGASCTSRTYAGTALGLTYTDTGNELKREEGEFRVDGLYETTELALTVLSTNWISQIGSVGSAPLEFLFRGMRSRYTADPMAEFEQYSSALLSLAVAKIISTESYNWAYVGASLTDGTSNPPTQAFLTELRSAAYLIGPQGFNKLWMIIIGLTFLELCIALWVTWKWPIVALNPLDPVSVLLVAQNSPATDLARGGGLGKVEQLPNPDEKIRYRAVNDTQLAFCWGNNDYHQPPVLGKLYG